MSNRRVFVRTACGAVIATDLVILGCGSPSVHELDGGDETATPSPVPTVTPNGNLLTFAIAEYPNLANVGGAAFGYVESLQLNVLVARIDASTFVGVNPRCTHRGCSVNYQSNNNRFNCGCHNANFATSGAVISGPAPAPLQSFPTTFDGTTVTVDISSAVAT